MTAAAAEALTDGLALHRSGRLDEAESRYGEAVEAEPANADAWHLLAHIAIARRDWKGAAARVLKAIRCRPETPGFHSTLGDILAAQNQQPQAAQCYRKALRLEPGFVPALVNLGNALQSQGLYREASVEYWKAIQAQPECAEAFSNLGNSLRAVGMNAEALQCYEEALRLRPRNAEVAVNMAAALICSGKNSEAEKWARQALAWQTGLVEALSNLSLAVLNQGRPEEAEEPAREAVVRAPAAAHLHSNLGSILLHQKRFAEAEASYCRAIDLQPGYPEAMNNLGLVMRSLERLDEAGTLFEDVVLRHPAYAEAWTNWGTVWQARNDQVQALVCFDKALRLQPGHAKSHFCRSLSLLAGGRFHEGFAEYEWRWKVMGEGPRALCKPAWDGGPLEGRTILLFPEQGLGDTLQFARYATLVAAHGGRVIVECQPAAVPLLRSVDGIADVISTEAPLPAFDVQCALMSLPGLLGTTVETIPAATPYLSADAGWTSRLAQVILNGHALRVGIAWAGNPLHGSNHLRSMPLQTLSALTGIPGVEWYSLHAGSDMRAQVQQSGAPVRHILTDHGGLPELAGLMCCLDLILTVDTMPAHLAGALDRPVWTMLSWAPDWRWQLEQSRSPWYPSMRLFRQAAPGDWASVIEEVAGELRRMTAQDSTSGTDKV
jgi:tetratricopeptide (TPR) repeat protein